ncbi:hypothetical protein OHA18_37805 [Kribbella sp. NBC_00709]|uniref:hypothetical protein n=1 Tax=Kribbella sp. NBC_00709 TaxID=2975972 RepID=UPI002E280944|nr:hypothetical protein [Kribbella sp. NBC_00709]
MTTTPVASGGRPPTVRRWSGWRTLLVILGSLLIVLGGGVFAGGAAGMLLHTQRDDDGYFTAGPERFSTETSVLSVPSLDIDVAGPDTFSAQDALGKVRIRLESRNAGTPLFIGIGPADAVAKYLNGVGHDELSDIDASPFKATYTAHPGDKPAVDAAGQSFWVASDSGTGARTLTWDVADGNWSVLIMNADGSPGVDADISAAAELPVILPISIAALVVGAVLLLIGIAVIVVTVATRNSRRDTATPGTATP